MKKLLVLSSLLALGSFAHAQDAPPAEAKKACPAQKCPDACADGCCEGTVLKLAVTGLDNDVSKKTAEVTLGALAGIVSCTGCDKSDTLTVKYNPETMKVADIEKAVTDSGLKVTGHKVAFKIKGMACQSCNNHLTALLGKTDGVINVDKVCHLGGHAAVTFDPKKTDATKLKAAIHTTRYQVVEAAKPVEAAEKPAAAAAAQG